MGSRRFARFEVSDTRELIKTAVGASLLVGAAEPILSVLARTIPRNDTQRLLRAWATAVIRFLDIEINVAGVREIDPGQQYVVAPLHEGFADALALSRLPIDLRYVARDELFEWRRLGRFLEASDQIMVKPEHPVAGLRGLLDECRRTFARGQSVVIFPQGSILGVEAAFTSGAFRLADRLGVPLLPVVITGTHRVWEHPYSDRLRFGQRVSMRALAPLPIGRATEMARETERRMKRIALSDDTAPARRFDPLQDGFWDGYRYEIDPDFPEVAALVERHRSLSRGSGTPDPPRGGSDRPNGR